MRKGDEGDCLYLILSGEVGIYMDQELKECIVQLGEKKVFGERALETDDKRQYLRLIFIEELLLYLTDKHN